MEKKIYVFMGKGANFPAGAFNNKENAIEWIKKYALSGVLSEYPIDVGLYDWAIEKGYFDVKKDYQKESKFVEKFTCASINHFHFEDGKID